MKKFMWVVMVMSLVIAGCDSSFTGSNPDDSSVDTTSDSSVDTSSDSSVDTESGTEPPPDCEVVGCGDAPDDTCDVEGNLLVYSGASVCVNHVCQYEFDIELCIYDCREVDGAADECMDDVCDGVVCGMTVPECYVPSITAAMADMLELSGRPPEDVLGKLGYLVPSIQLSCNPDTGACSFPFYADFVAAEYCGDVKGCISVSGGADHCDSSVFTKCTNNEDCIHRIPDLREEVEGGCNVTTYNYLEGVCDLNGSLTGTAGGCSYPENTHFVEGLVC